MPTRAIQTSNFSVQPQYAQNAGNGPERITGYQVSNQVDVTLDDTKKLGPALDALVGAGANQINSVGFDIADPAALQTAAREAAAADALKRAQTYAHAAGVTVGPVLSIPGKRHGDAASDVPRDGRTRRGAADADCGRRIGRFGERDRRVRAQIAGPQTRFRRNS